MAIHLGPKDALILVDVQRDFCPGGRLAVGGGDEIVPVLNRWIAHAKARGARIVASRDWHPPNHVSFEARDGPWPEHCVRDTEGAAFHPDLRLPADAEVVDKGLDIDSDNYSAFDGTGLADRLRAAGIERVWIGGLAQDVCARATVLDAIEQGFETHLIAEATRAVDVAAGDGARALSEMTAAGAQLEYGAPGKDHV